MTIQLERAIRSKLEASGLEKLPAKIVAELVNRVQAMWGRL
jgi:hypothetical protein